MVSRTLQIYTNSRPYFPHPVIFVPKRRAGQDILPARRGNGMLGANGDQSSVACSVYTDIRSGVPISALNPPGTLTICPNPLDLRMDPAITER